MNTGRTVFSQIMDFLPLREFRRCVNRYKGNYNIKHFTCYEQFFTMAFAQLTYRESLRDIEICMRSMRKKLYHIGIRSNISKSTLADANEKRDWRIYADFAATLIHTARKLYINDSFDVQLQQTAYVLDSTIISLCLSLFPWAPYRYGKGAVKLHTLLDLRGNIPSYIHVTGAKICDHDILDSLNFEPGSFYIMDRGYFDLDRLYNLHQQKAFFITRSKAHIKYRRLYSNTAEKHSGICCDQVVRFSGYIAKKHYPENIRRIKYFYAEKQQYLIFLTNNFVLPALTITELYKCRWQIELFFRWIKQHLRIKAFYGTSENAVKLQISIAICIYVLVSIIKKQLKLQRSLYEILQILSISIFEKVSLYQALTKTDCTFLNARNCNQLTLFEL